MTVPAHKGLYVQYGCGLSCPEGWRNYDASPRLRIEKLPLAGALMHAQGRALFPRAVLFGDIVRGLPVPDGTADAVYCSHVLEHIDRASVVVALANTLRMLKPGGVFRLVVPDLVWRCEKFVRDSKAMDASAADDFMRAAYLGRDQPRARVPDRLRAAFGNAEHRWMYDYNLMARLLADAGFVDIRRCEFGDADDRMFDQVEDAGRFHDSGNRELAIEARRSRS